MYKPQSDPRFKSALQNMSQRERARMNDPARKRQEEQARLIRLLSAVAPAVGSVGGGAIGAIGAGLVSGGSAIPAGFMGGSAIGGALGAGAQVGGNAYADYSTDKYGREDAEALSRQQAMYNTIGAMGRRR